MSRYLKPFLFLSSAVLLAVGLMLSFAPATLYATSGQILPDTILLRSDLRAGGMLLLLSGLFVFWSALRGKSGRSALQLSALIYLGYGLGRLVSFAGDGAPDAALVAVTGIEWVLGLAALVLLLKEKTIDAARPRAST